jgi:hypothetical protein
MKLLSLYYSDDMHKEAQVFFVANEEYRVVVRSDSGTHYSTTFGDENSAEDFAEDWIGRDEE